MKSAVRFVLIAICLSPGFRSRGAEENEAAKQLGLRAKARISQKTDREAIFHEIALSGGGRVYGLKFSFDLNPWGINFEALGEWIETFCVVDLICPPHLPRLRDVGDLAVLAITDGIPPSAFGCRIMFGAMLWEPGWLQEHLQSLAQQVGYAMFGCGEIYQVMLWDSPSLRGNLELLSRLPKPRLLLVVYTDQKDDEVLRLTRKTKIQAQT